MVSHDDSRDSVDQGANKRVAAQVFSGASGRTAAHPDAPLWATAPGHLDSGRLLGSGSLPGLPALSSLSIDKRASGRHNLSG